MFLSHGHFERSVSRFSYATNQALFERRVPNENPSKDHTLIWYHAQLIETFANDLHGLPHEKRARS